MKKCLPSKLFSLPFCIKKDTPASRDKRFETSRRSGRRPCATCRGTGRVVTSQGAICMEPVTKTAECPDCRGLGYS